MSIEDRQEDKAAPNHESIRLGDFHELSESVLPFATPRTGSRLEQVVQESDHSKQARESNSD